MEQFLILTTTDNRTLADAICQALEDAEIPLLLEHVEIRRDDDGPSAGFRILTPLHFRETAMRIVDVNAATHAVRMSSLADIRKPN